MLTIMKQTADNPMLSIINPLTFPTLLYDRATTQITVTVIVSPSSTDSSKPSFQVPPITIVGPAKGEQPLPTWTVSWNFVIDSSFQGHLYGIQIPLPPTGTSLPVQTVQSGAGQFTFTFITDDVTLRSFSYDIVESTTGSKQQFVEDPTIVVTPEPIGG